MEQTGKIVKSITEGIKEKKGIRIAVVNLERIESAICRYFVICEGSSPAQVGAIAEAVTERVQAADGEKPVRVIGLENAQWVAMDYIDVLVHIFLPDTRSYYDLEHLWEDADVTIIPDAE